MALEVTNFIVRNVLPVTREAVYRAERIVLSDRDTPDWRSMPKTREPQVGTSNRRQS
jgi:uncharacterized protein (DUF1778 family)